MNFIKEYRLSKNISVNEIATQLGMLPNNYSAIENNKRKLSLKKLDTLVSYYGLNKEEILPIYNAYLLTYGLQNMNNKEKVLEIAISNFNLPTHTTINKNNPLNGSKIQNISFDQPSVIQNSAITGNIQMPNFDDYLKIIKFEDLDELQSIKNTIHKNTLLTPTQKQNILDRVNNILKNKNI